MDNKMVKIVVAVVCLVLAAVIFARYFAGGNPLHGSSSDERPMKCTECKYAYVITSGEYTKQVDELIAAGKGSSGPANPPVICPKCGKQAAQRAIKCEKCGNIYLMGETGDKSLPDKCPKCSYSGMAQVGKK
jgi:predicted RNA-binding Zn-ribbon protein involved in translation (DUF1610 family)